MYFYLFFFNQNTTRWFFSILRIYFLDFWILICVRWHLTFFAFVFSASNRLRRRKWRKRWRHVSRTPTNYMREQSMKRGTTRPSMLRKRRYRAKYFNCFPYILVYVYYSTNFFFLVLMLTILYVVQGDPIFPYLFVSDVAFNVFFFCFLGQKSIVSSGGAETVSTCSPGCRPCQVQQSIKRAVTRSSNSRKQRYRGKYLNFLFFHINLSIIFWIFFFIINFGKIFEQSTKVIQFLHTYVCSITFNVFCFRFLCQELVVSSGGAVTVTTCPPDVDPIGVVRTTTAAEDTCLSSFSERPGWNILNRSSLIGCMRWIWSPILLKSM